MPSTPEAARLHYKTMQDLQVVALRTMRRSWDEYARAIAAGDPRIVEVWRYQVRQLMTVMDAVQLRAAFEGATYSAMTVAEQGVYVPATEYVDPSAFVGYASDGRDMDTLLEVPARVVQVQQTAGVPAVDALTAGRLVLDRIVRTQVADTGRQAAGADIVAREGVGYVRMLNPPSCSRCSILAGKWFRWNAGFRRHPHCDCVHVASRVGSMEAARSEGLIDDPYESFHRMSAAEQDATFGKAGAQAIRDGADMSQVVNSRRGMTANGVFTTEGTTRAGNAAKGLKPRQRRLTPDGIYELADRLGKDREWTLQELRTHGYLLPKGQVPEGALRGQREGWGQLGSRGGKTRGTSDPAVAARKAIEEARRTGVRDPNNRYTMTAAERRLYDAKRRYEVALSGRSPYRSNPGFGNTPDPYGLGLNTVGTRFIPVTPEELATAEREYRLWLASDGQVF